MSRRLAAALAACVLASTPACGAAPGHPGSSAPVPTAAPAAEPEVVTERKPKEEEDEDKAKK